MVISGYVEIDELVSIEHWMPKTKRTSPSESRAFGHKIIDDGLCLTKIRPNLDENIMNKWLSKKLW